MNDKKTEHISVGPSDAVVVIKADGNVTVYAKRDKDGGLSESQMLAIGLGMATENKEWVSKVVKEVYKTLTKEGEK